MIIELTKKMTVICGECKQPLDVEEYDQGENYIEMSVYMCEKCLEGEKEIIRHENIVLNKIEQAIINSLIDNNKEKKYSAIALSEHVINSVREVCKREGI